MIQDPQDPQDGQNRPDRQDPQDRPDRQHAQDPQDAESRLGESEHTTTLSDAGHLFADVASVQSFSN